MRYIILAKTGEEIDITKYVFSCGIQSSKLYSKTRLVADDELTMLVLDYHMQQYDLTGLVLRIYDKNNIISECAAVMITYGYRNTLDDENTT